MKQSLENNWNAIQNGVDSKPKEWQDALKLKTIEYIDEYYQLNVSNNFEKKAIKLNKLLSSSCDQLKYYIHFLICKTYYHGSIVALSDHDNDNYKLSVKLIKECYFHYQESKRLFKNKNINESIDLVSYLS